MPLHERWNYLSTVRRAERQLLDGEHVLAAVVDGARGEHGWLDLRLETRDEIHVEPGRERFLGRGGD